MIPVTAYNFETYSKFIFQNELKGKCCYLSRYEDYLGWSNCLGLDVLKDGQARPVIIGRLKGVDVRIPKHYPYDSKESIKKAGLIFTSRSR